MVRSKIVSISNVKIQMTNECQNCNAKRNNGARPTLLVKPLGHKRFFGVWNVTFGI